MAKKARQAASDGLTTLNALKKPDNMSQDDFDKQKKAPAILFNYTAANASMTLKDYPAAIESYKAVLAVDPRRRHHQLSHRPGLHGHDAAAADGRILVFRQAVPPRGANQAQANQVKTYLRKLILNYQQAACDNLIDAELNELLAACRQLGGSSVDLHAAQLRRSRRRAQGHDHRVGDHRPESRRRQSQGDLARFVRSGISRCAGQADRSDAGSRCRAVEGRLRDQRRRV